MQVKSNTLRIVSKLCASFRLSLDLHEIICLEYFFPTFSGTFCRDWTTLCVWCVDHHHSDRLPASSLRRGRRGHFKGFIIGPEFSPPPHSRARIVERNAFPLACQSFPAYTTRPVPYCSLCERTGGCGVEEGSWSAHEQVI